MARAEDLVHVGGILRGLRFFLPLRLNVLKSSSESFSWSSGVKVELGGGAGAPRAARSRSEAKKSEAEVEIHSRACCPPVMTMPSFCAFVELTLEGGSGCGCGSVGGGCCVARGHPSRWRSLARGWVLLHALFQSRQLEHAKDSPAPAPSCTA